MEHQKNAREKATTSSLSKGCFLFNANSRGEQRVLRDVFQRLPGERDADAKRRQSAHTSCWSAVKKIADAVIVRQHDKIFTDLLDFSKRAQKHLSSLHQSSLAQAKGLVPEKFLPPRLEVPTAALVAGVNLPDHGVLFGDLKERLHECVTPRVVLLKSKDCNTGTKATMKEVLRQLMQADTQPLAEAEENGETVSSKSSKRMPLPSMPILSSWYGENHGAEWPPVVVIVEDFEGFSPHVLQDLVASFSPHLPSFPVILVLGLATSVAAVHRSLPRSTSSLLCIEQFHTQHSTLTLSQVIEEVFLTPSQPFKLGPRSLQFLLHQFFYCNFSLTQLTSGIQFSTMEHFYWQPLSGLCTQRDKRDSAVGRLSDWQCDAVRATPSFQRHVESQPPERQIKLLENKTVLKREVRALLSSLGSHDLCFYPLLWCLHILTKDLPRSPLARKIHELYLLCLESNITGSDRFQTAWSLLRVLCQDELTKLLQACNDVLQCAVDTHSSDALTEILTSVKSFCHELGHLGEEETTAGDTDIAVIPVGEETTGERKMRFQERLRQLAVRKREPNAFEKFRLRLTDFLLEVFRTHLVSPQTLPLHELFYFNHVSSLKKHLAAAPRAALQMALSKPKYYLPSASNASEQSVLETSMPDICIAYQLHLECGRLINLFDWLQSFVAVVQPGSAGERGEDGEEEEEGRRRKKRTQDIDPVLHARFIQAVSELQFLGFIKPTQRKTDHVQRLTWGAC